ncbi:MAG: peptidylprolyl isomerase [Desulfobacteraceae bacterium]|nr:peptidylprolyl isomerase [Desulfobacteraceae bacterium]
MATASARHILVESEDFCKELIDKLNDGGDFEQLAKEHSKCPSGRNGGDLGKFGPGQMVPEFDTVVFNEEVGIPHGPVKTDFGFHIVEITNRDE